MTMAFVDEDRAYCLHGRAMNSAKEMTATALLWRSVLAQAVKDVYSGDTGARMEVIRWLKSEDFDVVCEFAEVDIPSMREQLASLIALPLPLARKYGKPLRDQIMVGIYND